MHVLQSTGATRDAAESPEWVADWWMPDADRLVPDAGVDHAGMRDPAPVMRIEVTGRPAVPAIATR
jgi:hypothetical protein